MRLKRRKSGLSGRITELTTLKEKISGAESLQDLKTIMSSSHGIPGVRDDMMNHGRHGGRECHMDKPDSMNSVDDTTNNSTDETTDISAS
jgi:hypothetical protein